jgi:hypothetical protein
MTEELQVRNRGWQGVEKRKRNKTEFQREWTSQVEMEKRRAVN